MLCETHGFHNTAHWVVRIALLGAMLLCGARLPAQEATHKHGAVRGTVSLVKASQEPSTSEGLQLELKPLAESAVSLSAVTDAVGNYEFKDVGDGDYILRLEAEGFEPFTATIRVRDGASIIQNISVKSAGLTQRIEVKEQAEPLSANSSGASKLSEKQLAALPLAEENFKASLLLTPGVVRTPDGKLNFRGAGEDQSKKYLQALIGYDDAFVEHLQNSLHLG